MKQEEILKRTSIINVKNKLELEELYSKKDIIYVKCPFCFSKNGAMKLNTFNNSYNCKDCGESGYAIGLYAKCKHTTNKEAYQKLLQEVAEISNNLINSITTNTKKNTEELDIVYQAFLEKLSLSSEHTMKLLKLGFTIDEIKKIGFKTIPIKEQDRIKICKELIENGYELEGCPGFFQDKKFRWNFKSHKGFFIPVIENCRVIALRIHLDNQYNTNTTDIWFSSSQENNGSKVNNHIMVLFPENNKLQVINDNKQKKDIIITSEMLLAYKISATFKNNIVIRST